LPAVTVALGAVAAMLAVRLVERLRIAGESMVPTLRPGDRVLLVRRLGRWWPAIRPGDLVALADPRVPERLVVKRVAGVDGVGVAVLGDNTAHSTDSRHFGPVERRAIRGRVVYRYHPEDRRGRLGSATPRTRW
jgi:nickel-type superoxide dismutase maturation protease